MTDRELIEATLRGEREAFGQLVERYQRLVEAAAYCATRRRDLVDDVVQDTFITAWRTIDRLRDVASLRSWLYGIAKNLGHKARRRHGRALPIEGASTTPLTPLDTIVQREQDHEIASALGRLPARYRDPLVLFYYEQCSVKEVAATLALQEDAAMQRLSRGRRKLGDALATRVESVLEKRPSQAALGAGLLLVLPARSASATAVFDSTTAVFDSMTDVATQTITSTANTGSIPGSIAGPITGSIIGSISAWLGAYWRIVGATAGTAAAIAAVAVATSHSQAVAAKSSAHTAATKPPAPQAAAPSAPPRPSLLDPGEMDHYVHKVVGLASLDPVEACNRGARSLVMALLGKGAIVERNGMKYYEPSEELLAIMSETGKRVGATCGGDEFPELYIACEGSIADIRDGNVTCYPHDIFQDPWPGKPYNPEPEEVIVQYDPKRGF
jgi:RNA polymerase sigma factor (sigma-70 family)